MQNSNSNSEETQADEAKSRQMDLIASRVLFVSIVLYAVSFALPAFRLFLDGTDHESGLTAFIAAMMGSPFISTGQRVLMLACWTANPLGWIALALFRNRRFTKAYISAGIAVVLAALMWLHAIFLNKDFLLAGYYIWLLSFMILACACAVKWAWPMRIYRGRGFEVVPQRPE